MKRFSSALLVALSLAYGCAHAPSETPAAPQAPPASTRASAPARGRSSPPQGAPSAGAAPSAPPARLDPAEEITPRELASIPDPVPGTPTEGGNASGTSSPATSAAQPQTLPSSDPRANATNGTGASGGAAAVVSPTAPAAPAGDPASSGKRSVWRVQIYASPMLQEADRIAKDASAKLGEGYVLEFEGTLYKVRLGAFDTEDAAKNIRERAIRLGYAGAFRMREDAEMTPAKE